VVNIDLHSEVLAHMHGIGETVINWIQFLKHHKEVCEEDNHLIRGVVED
jgi:hypothetical protein